MRNKSPCDILVCIIGCVLAFLLGGTCSAQPGKAPALAADPKIQALIRQAVGDIDEGRIDKNAIWTLEELA
jgi:hypothetical protein